MNYRKMMLVACTGLLLCAQVQAQEAKQAMAQTINADPGYAGYIAGRKARLAQNLHQRIAGIEKSFSEEMIFRGKLKDERIAFEKKLEKQQSDLLDSLKTEDPPTRMAAWSAYYEKTGKEREDFYASMRQESRQFWETRLSAGAQEQPQQAISAATGK